MRRLAEFEVTNDFLCQLLNLPDGTVVKQVWSDNWRSFFVLVESPAIPEGDCAAHVNPSFERINSEAVKFIDWNIIEKVSDE